MHGKSEYPKAVIVTIQFGKPHNSPNPSYLKRGKDLHLPLK